MDAEIEMGNAHALLRMADWIDLARLVARLAGASANAYLPVTNVSKTTPRL